ncbi:NUDIX domain-containing protein [Pontibacter korlensis]|uniref:NUDIX hydrolase n=1 Tax=Pontibacter korlensis TaxID=400092 RepID=A0A0E3ZHN6_9BACT|nr:NUDIX domain-containing protein [Pontibacter korlensis]AKD04578.1 NUDIX hydrolase [Pontibacter korlensis]
MPDLNPNAAAYADKLRIRVCGICIKDDKLVVVRHGKTIDNYAFWAPPGGGLQYGESMQDCLKREFLEETGLQVEVGRFLYVNEFLHPPLHAVEFFFEVQTLEGELATGYDPEAQAEGQLIEHVQWMSVKELQNIPRQDKHRVLQLLLSLDDLLGLPHNFMP